MTQDELHGRLLLAEDDAVFATTLARVLGRRGFEVHVASDAAGSVAQARRMPPDFAVVDLKLGDDNGLALIAELRSLSADMRIVMLTGYASIATAVEAVKRGADEYLAKPVDAESVVRALLRAGGQGGGAAAELPQTPLPLRRLEWEHIQRTLLDCDGNITEAARRLGMHRRTLQRKLDKHPGAERAGE